MQLIRRLDASTPTAPTALAIGNFDGLHRGHRAVLSRMLAIADARALVPAVLTFVPHPRRFFRPDAPVFCVQPLREKLAALRAMGVARVFALRFDAAFAALTAEDFLQQVLFDGMGTRAVVTGENFVFGARRGGDIGLLQRWGADHGMHSEQVPPVQAGAQVCSSTALRAALAVGDMMQAALLLSQPYSLTGRVQHGQKQGRALGTPTANIVPPSSLLLPRHGVYAVTSVLHGVRHAGVANLGLRPTMGASARPQLEAHFFDFQGDLYGQRLSVQLHAHLRDEQRFDNVARLVQQIGLDAQQARTYLAEIQHD